MANGATVTGLNPDYYLSLKGNQNLQVGNFVLTVDASIPRNIYLPSIAGSDAKFGNGQTHLYIIKNGSENVTLIPNGTDGINGNPASLVLDSTSPPITDLLIFQINGVANLWITSSFVGGANVPSLAWNVALSCDVDTHQTTITVTALKKIDHPFALYGVGASSDILNIFGGNVDGTSFDHISAGDSFSGLHTSPIVDILTLRLFDSLGNWSNKIVNYTCHA